VIEVEKSKLLPVKEEEPSSEKREEERKGPKTKKSKKGPRQSIIIVPAVCEFTPQLKKAMA
jgi:hypothetical protein